MEMELYRYNLQMHRRKVLIVLAWLYLERKKKNQRSKRRRRVQTLLKERQLHGHCRCLTTDLQLTNSAQYQNYIRMSASTFEELLSIVGPKLERFPGRPDVLSVGEILTATLRYLASGESMMSIMCAFPLGKTTFTNLIFQCCTILWDTLVLKVLVKPDTYKWVQLAEDYQTKWQIPNCVGSIDGKYIVNQAFVKSGSTYYTKRSHSIILIAMCDASYNFTLVDIGIPSRCVDGGIFSTSEIGKGFKRGTLNFPPAIKIKNINGIIPFYAVGDKEFPLLTNLMRPYPVKGKRKLPFNKAVFNYRLSRGMHTIDNTFGIMASNWWIFKKPIIAEENTVIAITKAAVVLHNFVKMSEKNAGVRYYSGPIATEIVERDQWRIKEMGALAPVSQLGSNCYSENAKAIRNKFCDYFVEEGAIESQYERLYN